MAIEWIKCDERLPEDERDVLVWHWRGFAEVDCYMSSDDGWEHSEGITHWAEINAPTMEVKDANQN